MTKPKTELRVLSYLAENWHLADELPPALVLNPEAHYLELLAWCWGEVQSLHASAKVMAHSECAIFANDISAIFLSRLGPLAEVMTVAIDTGMSERVQPKSAGYATGASNV